jgi:hypothetical protein
MALFSVDKSTGLTAQVETICGTQDSTIARSDFSRGYESVI